MSERFGDYPRSHSRTWGSGHVLSLFQGWGRRCTGVERCGLVTASWERPRCSGLGVPGRVLRAGAGPHASPSQQLRPGDSLSSQEAWLYSCEIKISRSTHSRFQGIESWDGWRWLSAGSSLAHTGPRMAPVRRRGVGRVDTVRKLQTEALQACRPGNRALRPPEDPLAAGAVSFLRSHPQAEQEGALRFHCTPVCVGSWELHTGVSGRTEFPSSCCTSSFRPVLQRQKRPG